MFVVLTQMSTNEHHSSHAVFDTFAEAANHAQSVLETGMYHKIVIAKLVQAYTRTFTIKTEKYK